MAKKGRMFFWGVGLDESEQNAEEVKKKVIIGDGFFNNKMPEKN